MLPTRMASSSLGRTQTSTIPFSSSSPDAFNISASQLLQLCQLWTVLHHSSPPKICRALPPPPHPPINVAADECDDCNLAKTLHKIHSGGSDNNDNEFLLNSRMFNSQRGGVTDNRPISIQKHNRDFGYYQRTSTRSLSIVGILGGIVLILVLVALSACIRLKRNMVMFHSPGSTHEALARQILLDHLRHATGRQTSGENEAVINEPPPAYDEVVSSTSTTSGNGAAAASLTGTVGKPDEDDEEQPPSYFDAVTVASTTAAAALTVNGQPLVVDAMALAAIHSRVTAAGRTMDSEQQRPPTPVIDCATSVRESAAVQRPDTLQRQQTVIQIDAEGPNQNSSTEVTLTHSSIAS